MLEKFSVKKPLTVVVAVILVFVLGFISFGGMTSDLLPEMELPYVIAITPYPGASPEKVEAAVTRPLETTLGTAGGIKNVTSISNENASMVMLEFEQDTNMDSAMIELSNSLDMVKSALPDGVGTTTMLKISPDMMPVMVMAVDSDGMDVRELSAYVSETLLPAFERLDGVASVTASGLVENRVRISLDQDKIDALNDKVLATVDSGLAKAQQELREGKKQLEEGKRQLEEGKAALSTQKDTTISELAASSAQLANAIAQLNALLAEESVLTADRQAFEAERAGMQQLSELAPQLRQLADGIVQAVFAAQMQRPDEAAAADPVGYIRDHVSDEQFSSLLALLAQRLPDALPEGAASMSRTDFLATYDKAASAAGRLAEIEKELRNLDTRAAVLAAMKPELETQLAQATAGYEQLESGKLTASGELTKAEQALADSEAALAETERQLEEAQSQLDASRDEAYKKANIRGTITADMISGLLTAENFSMPAGYIREGSEQFLLKVGDAFASVEELQNALLFHMEEESVGDIRLTDVAAVEVADNADESYARINGNDGIMLSFQKQSISSTSAVTDRILEEMERLTGADTSLHLTSLMNQGDYIHLIVGSVLQNLLIGGLLAIVVLAFFLKDVKPTVIVAFSIPISLLFAVVLMYFSNITLNIISLSGLALGVGMLVDNSIVVIENIYRLRNEGVPAAKAAVMGAREVAGAIFASTLTTVCVFLPIVFTDGLSRQLFTDMGLTIAYSLLASLVVALTVVPAMGSTVLRKTAEKQHRWFDAFVNGYEKVLRFSLSHRALVLLGAVALLGLSVWQTARMGTAFIPSMDGTQMSATLTLAEDAAEDADLRALSDQAAERIQALDSVRTVGAMESGGNSLFGGASGGSISYYILLDEDTTVSNSALSRQMQEAVADLPVVLTVSESNMDMSALGGSGVELVIQGRDLDVLSGIAADMKALLGETAGLVEIEADGEAAGTETRLTVDKDAAMRHGLTVAQVYQSIAAALTDTVESTTLTVGNDDYAVVIEKNGDPVTRENLLDLKLSGADGEEVRLGDIASSKEAGSLLAISRDNGVRTMSVTAAVDAEHNIGLVGREIEEKLAAYTLPEGYTVELAGENESIASAMSDLLLMVLVAVIFIYLIMVAQFQSFRSPFIVMFTMPLAFTGGLLALWITGQELSVVAMLGFLMLAGVVVNNGIVFVDYVNRLRMDGMERREALVATGRTRLRPILMTALTTILAMTTMALGIGDGAEMTQAMGIVMVGGLLYSTLMTLIVIPVMYDFLGKKQLKRVDIGEETASESASDAE